MAPHVTNVLARTLREIAGPAYRRLRRELQWLHPMYRVVRSDTSLPYIIATHATPLFRRLAGVDPALQRNKVVNLTLAARRLDGVTLEPRQRLSFWREVGAPTYRKGYLDGLVLSHGSLTRGVGGGLCQMTNLLYWMTLHTPLTVIERWRHSYDVFPDANRTQPFGSGATCAWPALDLQVANQTPAAFRLSITVTTTHLVGTWTSDVPCPYTYRIEERDHHISHDGPGVFRRHNELWRLTFDGSGDLIEEARVARNDALMMYEPFLPPARTYHDETEDRSHTTRPCVCDAPSVW